MVWQHRWAVWGGILGATASSLAKMAVSKDSPPLNILQDYCRNRLFPRNNSDLGDIVLSKVYKIVGDLMIHHRINLMPHVQSIRNRLEDLAVQLHIFEVDDCQVLLLGPRIVLLITMLVMNAYMIGAFLKGMKLSGSVAGAALTTACNFGMSALLGAWIWEERFPSTWWLGFSCVMMGVLLLSSVPQPTSQLDKNNPKDNWKKNRANDQSVPNSVARKYGKVMEAYEASSSPLHSASIDTTSYRGGRPSLTTSKAALELQARLSSSTTTPTSRNTSNTSTPRTPKSAIKPNKARIARQRKVLSPFIDRSFFNECPLCEDPLFDDDGKAEIAVADLSPSCYHRLHARCLKHQQKQEGHSRCPICERNVPMFMNAKESAHFGGFWIQRIETCLKKLGVARNGQPQPASLIRTQLLKDPSLTEDQKQYINDDPTGLGKGLQSALEWGGSIDYNSVQQGHRGWHKCLRTKGIWMYSSKEDDLWLWKWGEVHPRQRCDQCQIGDDLKVSCPSCQGSSEAAYYCSEACQKRDRQRHKMTCQMWQRQGPNSK